MEYAWSSRDAVGIGFYRNGNWRDTNYAVYRGTPWNVGSTKFGMVVGIADGYAANDGHFSPVAGLIPVTWCIADP
ncbi:MAG TPA: hypothetical protein VGC95_01610 [Chitinophagaceae bacterium]